MKRRIGLVRTCVIGALLTSVAWAVSGMQAQAGDLPVKAPAAAEAVPYWWFHGEVEAGGRFFLNNPQRNGSVYLNQQSLAKFYEYRDLRPGPFGNIWLATGSSDGLYQIDFGAKNIGYNDQSYYLDLSKAGEHYLSLGWDETPHLYSTSALTIFSGVGTNALTPTCGRNLLVGSLAGQGASINPCLTPTDIGIRRDTASAAYRWTPTDAWDIKADYSHMARKGTQVDGITGLGTTGSNGNAIQVPKPVNDSTQNYGLNGEYAGSSPWGQKITYKLGYSGSQYTDDISAYTVATPFTTGNPIAQMSTWPSNQANAFNGTVAADLPWKSRYVGTLSYAMMTQNQTFNPMTANPTASAALNILPASSLNGEIDTLLSNNVVTTKISPELTNKLSYRYYNYNNNTPSIHFPSFVLVDSAVATAVTLNSLVLSYVKQNAGEELNWRPSREWNLGAAYGYERYSYNGADADVTYENSGKVYADWKPTSWFGTRSSVNYSNRRYDQYDYLNFVGNNLVNSAGYRYSPAYRQMMFSNRQSWKANYSADIVVLPGLTITPNARYKDDNYSVDPNNQSGLEDDRSWSGGVDVGYSINRDVTVMVGYLREYRTQLLFGGSATTGNTRATNLTNDRTIVDTFTAAANYAAIPDKLDLDFRYTASHGLENQQLVLNTATGIPGLGQFPDNSTWFQRLDASATYRFDPAVVAQSGGKGQLKAKLRYVWERNSVANWQYDWLAPYNNPGATGQQNGMYLVGDNPNYNVHLLSASLIYSW
jgi:MtrB/PioB family decaheme-associated outer membrane protein